MSLTTIFESLAESIPVKVAARLALLGVVTLATLGFAYYSQDRVHEAQQAARIEHVQAHQDALEADVENRQASLKKDIEKRLDRMEDKLDKLLLRTP